MTEEQKHYLEALNKWERVTLGMEEGDAAQLAAEAEKVKPIDCIFYWGLWGEV